MIITPLLPGLSNTCSGLSFSVSLPPLQLVRELLHEGQALSVGVSAESGQGCQWLARIRWLIKEGSVPDISLVPVGISYDCVPETNTEVNAYKHTYTLASTDQHKLGAICNCDVLGSNQTGLVLRLNETAGDKAEYSFETSITIIFYVCSCHRLLFHWSLLFFLQGDVDCY